MYCILLTQVNIHSWVVLGGGGNFSISLILFFINGSGKFDLKTIILRCPFSVYEYNFCVSLSFLNFASAINSIRKTYVNSNTFKRNSLGRPYAQLNIITVVSVDKQLCKVKIQFYTDIKVPLGRPILCQRKCKCNLVLFR